MIVQNPDGPRACFFFFSATHSRRVWIVEITENLRVIRVMAVANDRPVN